MEGEFTPERGRAAVALVDAAVRAGQPPSSVVSVTGLPLTPRLRALRERGLLDRLPMFDRITSDGVSANRAGRAAAVEIRRMLAPTGAVESGRSI